jgi:hypothetical protein
MFSAMADDVLDMSSVEVEPPPHGIKVFNNSAMLISSLGFVIEFIN